MHQRGPQAGRTPAQRRVPPGCRLRSAARAQRRVPPGCRLRRRSRYRCAGDAQNGLMGEARRLRWAPEHAATRPTIRRATHLRSQRMGQPRHAEFQTRSSGEDDDLAESSEVSPCSVPRCRRQDGCGALLRAMAGRSGPSSFAESAKAGAGRRTGPGARGLMRRADSRRRDGRLGRPGARGDTRPGTQPGPGAGPIVRSLSRSMRRIEHHRSTLRWPPLDGQVTISPGRGALRPTPRRPGRDRDPG